MVNLLEQQEIDFDVTVVGARESNFAIDLLLDPGGEGGSGRNAALPARCDGKRVAAVPF